MKRIALVYGSVAGIISILGPISVLAQSGVDASDFPEWLGYLVMIVAFSMIFVGIKRYRDQNLGGVIKFGAAFLLGLGIALVSSLVYVLVWEVYLAATDYVFMENYIAGIIKTKEAAGLTDAALEAEIAILEGLREQYANPVFRLPMTFIEIFPAGLAIALVSAAILRNQSFLPARGGASNN